MKTLASFLLFIFFLIPAESQIPFEHQSRNNDERVPIDIEKKFLNLLIYNSSKPFLYKGIENRVGISCGSITKDKLAFERIQTIKEVSDHVNWFSSQYNRWVSIVDPTSDWGNAKQWIDNDTLKWYRIFHFYPINTDSLKLKCYYKVSNSDSIEIGRISIPVVEIPKPKLKIADKNIFPQKISKQQLLKIETLLVDTDFDHPDKEKYSKITYFEFVIKRGRKEKVMKWYGNYFARDMREAIYNAKKNTKITFRNIRSEKVKFDNVFFIIKNTSIK